MILIKSTIIYSFLIIIFILFINTLGWNIYLNERYKALERVCQPQMEIRGINKFNEVIDKYYKDLR